MKNKLMDLKEKIMLRKRNLIETVFDYLKNKMNIEHTRDKSHINSLISFVSSNIIPQLFGTKHLAHISIAHSSKINICQGRFRLYKLLSPSDWKSPQPRGWVVV